MGINLSIVKRDFKDHPQWDSGRHAGDREVAIYLADEPDTVTQDDLFRPGNVRSKLPEMLKLAHGVNAERWGQLATIIEKESDYWLYISW